jgi:predicted GNAT superfamily acetyltransferase
VGAIEEKPVAGIVVRHCRALEEFEACLEMERTVWAAADIDLVPLPIFVVMAHTGGQILGAFDGARMVGFTLAFPAYQHGRLLLHSHMTAVLEPYRDKGVGRRLKLFQREDALSRGIELVEWTFDPLELKNAYFNLERLGAVAREFLPNVYGITTSPLHGGMPTDRLMAQWWLRSPRVEERVAGAAPRKPSSRAARIVVPRNIGELKETNPEEAIRVQASVRQQFLEWLGRGYILTGIELDEKAGTYILEPAEEVKGL